jgi:hypothetical protein
VRRFIIYRYQFDVTAGILTKILEILMTVFIQFENDITVDGASAFSRKSSIVLQGQIFLLRINIY